MDSFEWKECVEAAHRLWPKLDLNEMQSSIWKEKLGEFERDKVMAAMKSVFSSGEYPKIFRIIKALEKGRFTGGIVKRDRLTDRQAYLQLLTAKAPQRLSELEMLDDADLEITYHRECYNRAMEVYFGESPSLKAFRDRYYRAMDRHGREVR
jgi:hypothetical protein